MTRISAYLLVQAVDNDVVILDESAGQEVLIRRPELGRLIDALRYFAEQPIETILASGDVL